MILETASERYANTRLVDELVKRVFSSPAARYGPYAMVSEKGTPILGNILTHYQIYNRKSSFLLQVYRGLQGIGGKFWEQETRMLMRLGRLGHPGLPKIERGAYDEKDGDDFAFVISDRGEATLNDRREMEYYRNNKAAALWQFGVLADALTTLHLHGVQHRNLWHGTIERYGEGDGRRLRLVRFEMSSLFASLFRSVTTESPDSETRSLRDDLRKLSIEQGLQSLSCIAPERLEFLAEDSSEDQPLQDIVHTARADVFSLGVIAAQWFGATLPDQDALAGIYEGGRVNKEAHKDFLRSLRRALSPAELPKGLRQLLEDMIERKPSERPDSHKVSSEISKNYPSWSMAWRPVDTRKRLIGFLAGEIGENLRNTFHLIVHDPATSEVGKEETKELIEEDVKNRNVVYSPNGYRPFAGSTPTPEMSDAKHVLLGQKAAWFCQLFRPEGGGDSEPWKDFLLVKYIALSDRLTRRKIAELYNSPYQQRIGDVEVEPVEISNREYLNQARAGRPDWPSVLKLTEFTEQRPEEHVIMDRAFTFLLSYFEIELKTRCYPFTRKEQKSDRTVPENPGGEGDTVTLDYNGPRWDAYVANAHSTLFSFYVHGMDDRMLFGSFFTNPGTYDEGEREVVYFENRNEGPGKQRLGTAIVKRSSNPLELTIEVTGGKPVPSSGWLAPASDFAQREELRRQALAVSDLIPMGFLVDQFIKPKTTRMLRHNWEGAGENLKDDTLPPEQTGQHFVQEMLACEPFFALHGPPGTGKTHVVSYAIVERLKRDPTARILVSAQSNFALDNLGERITRLLGNLAHSDEHLSEPGRVMRVASEAAVINKRVSAPMKKHLIQNLTRDTAHSIKEKCNTAREKLHKAGQHKLAEIVEEWIKRVDATNPDLKERTRRGANVVLATCSQATRAASRKGLDSHSADLTVADQFDWVIIEEAAKAWPTELAIPLVRGHRWTLVGDHKQLPAHRLTDIDRFLAKCVGNKDSEIKQHGADRDKYMYWFEAFRTIFEGRKEAEEEVRKVRSNDPPVGRMSVQYRMRPPIAQVISRSFYKDPPLQSHLSVEGNHHGLERPPFLRSDGALFWIDTSEEGGGYEEETNWKNPAEAALIRDFLYKLEPFPRKGEGPFSQDPLAIVSPYRLQNKEIREHLRGNGRALTFPVSQQRRNEVADLVDQDLVHSVHTIQGREADVVIASLVRTGRGGDSVNSALGHVAQETLINVLFSRARLLLVLIGNFRFFQKAAKLYPRAAFWGDVCDAVIEHGKKVSVEDLYER